MTSKEPSVGHEEEASQDGELVKVTILLPKDTVEKLDKMGKVALMGSRGRVIQALVDAVTDSAGDVRQILTNAGRLGQMAQFPLDENRVRQMMGTIPAFMFNIALILTRLNKFLGVEVPPPNNTHP